MSLLVVCWHRVTLLGLSIPIEILGVDQVSNLRRPGRGDATAVDKAPIDSSEPLVSLDLFSAILN